MIEIIYQKYLEKKILKKNLKTKILAIICICCLTLCNLNFVSFAAEFPNQTVEKSDYSKGVTTSLELQNRLDELISKYKGTYWTSTGTACASHSSACYSKYYYGWQCKGFATYIFNELFCGGYLGRYDSEMYYIPNPTGANLVEKAWGFSSTDIEKVKSILSQGKPGDYIQARGRDRSSGHSMIFVSKDDSGVWLFDCNSDNKCGVNYYYLAYSKFTSRYEGMSLYHSTNYPGEAKSCSCSDSYAGNYTCTTNTTLNIRGGHGTSYSIVGSIPSKATVYVSKADGSWAHIEYNGILGYVSMDYLEKQKVINDTEPPKISDVKITNITSEGYIVTCKVTDNDKVVRVQFPTWTTNNGQDDLLKDWQTNNSLRGIKNENTYTFRVFTSEHNNESGEYNTHIYAYDASGNYSGTPIEIDVPKKTLNDSLKGKLTVDNSTAALIKEKGSHITLEPIASGGSGNYTYKYAVLNVETGKWSVLKDFSETKTYTYVLNYTGKKEFATTVKDSKGNTVATNRIAVNVTDKQLSGNLTVGGSTEALTKEKGSHITLEPIASGGSGSYTYKYAVLNVDTGKWSVLKDFSETKTYIYALNYPGKKEFAVTIKDSKGNTVATNRIAVNVTEQLSGKLTVGGSTATLIKEKGSKIILTSSAIGGSGNYTYKYAVLNADTGKWSVLKDFSETKTYIYALNYPGKKEFAVTVKDSKGNTVATNRIKVTVTN